LPGFSIAPDGADTRKRTVVDSSWRVNVIGALAGVEVQPGGNSMCATALAAAGE
jgi:hypothetical protein